MLYFSTFEKNKILKKGWTAQIPTFFLTIFCNKCCFFALAWVFDKNRIYRLKDIIIENSFLKHFEILFPGTHSLKKNRRANYFYIAQYCLKQNSDITHIRAWFLRISKFCRAANFCRTETLSIWKIIYF